MTVGGSAYLKATVCPEGATNKCITWCSSNTSVATVNPSSGLVMAQGAGTAIIYATAQDGSGKQGSCKVTVEAVPVEAESTNCLFDTTKTDNIKAEFVALLGNKKGLVGYAYTTSECVDIVIENDATITNFANCFGIPKTLIQTILLRELWCLNTFDVEGDGAVINYFAWKEECEYWENQSSLYQATHDYPAAPIPYKEDSSTGLGQIFASVAIKAYNEAIDHRYISGSKIDSTNWKERKNVWFSLKDDNEYNINMTTLNILSCINEYCYGYDFHNYTPDMYKQVFTRYNADMDTINDYGQECYEYFLIFNKYL